MLNAGPGRDRGRRQNRREHCARQREEVFGAELNAVRARISDTGETHDSDCLQKLLPTRIIRASRPWLRLGGRRPANPTEIRCRRSMQLRIDQRTLALNCAASSLHAVDACAVARPSFRPHSISTGFSGRVILQDLQALLKIKSYGCRACRATRNARRRFDRWMRLRRFSIAQGAAHLCGPAGRSG